MFLKQIFSMKNHSCVYCAATVQERFLYKNYFLSICFWGYYSRAVVNGTSKVSQHAEWDLNKIEKTFNGTFAR